MRPQLEGIRRRAARAFQVRWFALARRLGLASKDELTFAVLAPIVGIFTGLVALGIQATINGVQELCWGTHGHPPLLHVLPAGSLPAAVTETASFAITTTASVTATALAAGSALSPHGILSLAQQASPLHRVLALLVGGVAVSILITVFKQSVRGHGMSGIIESVALRGGHIKPGPAILREVAGCMTVGAGGSLGREGPMIRTGAMIASVVGARAGLEGRRLKVLVGCGAAAGMAAAYNAPVGAAIFVMEVILGNFAVELFGPIVVASVLADAIYRWVHSAAPLYHMHSYRLVSAMHEFPAYLILGVIGGFLSIAFSRGVRQGEVVFDRLAFMPKWLKPILGMGLVGLMAIVFPHILGNGFDAVNLVLDEKLRPLVLLALLPVLKIIATGATLGSGCAGGLFTPTLFVGALFGGLFGLGVHTAMPNHTAEYGAYALVGMGAITAGSSHAPISSIIIIFEMTGDYDVILPLMLASIASAFVARRLSPHSIYTEALARRGITISSRLEEIVMESLTVEAVLRKDHDPVAPRDPVKALVEKFLAARRTSLSVVERGVLVGTISLHDLKHILRDGSLDGVIASDVASADRPVALAKDRLTQVLKTFAEHDLEELPVVEDEKTRRYLGIVSKQDILRIYSQEVLGQPARLARLVSEADGEKRTDFIELPPGYEVREVELGRALAGETLATLKLPQRFGAWALALRRRDDSGEWQRSIPKASTELLEADRLLVLGHTADLARFALTAAGKGDGAAQPA